jgi:hypothetical protein
MVKFISYTSIITAGALIGFSASYLPIPWWGSGVYVVTVMSLIITAFLLEDICQK